VHPAVVIANVSGSANTSADEAVLTSIDHNLLYVVPAGNDGGDACANSPARVGPALTVGATGRTDQVYFASNQGTCVDIFAPGEEIPGPSSSDDTTITSAWGTSEAAPHVAGVAATYLAANPTATSIEVMNAIVGASTVNVITGLGVGSPNRLLFSDFVTCPTGTTLCSGRCADLTTEKANCGACGATCTGTCSGGTCTPAPVCPSGTRDCCHDGVCRPFAVCSRIEC
jgi:hypothetical protein